MEVQSEVEKNRGILDQATAYKDAGNQHYAAKDYRAAMRCYHKCLLQARVLVQLPSAAALRPTPIPRTTLKRKSESEPMDEAPIVPIASPETSEVTLDEDPDSGSGGPVSEEPEPLDELSTTAGTLVTTCYNNLAACLLNGPQRDQESYLRAAEYCDKVLAKDPLNEKALFRKGQAYMAAQDYEKALDCFTKTPSNAEAGRRKKECQAALDAERKARDDEIRRNFEKSHRRQQAEAAVPGNAAAAPDVPNGHLPSTSAAPQPHQEEEPEGQD